METKLFELRDKATFIPVMCTLMESEHDQEAWLLRRAGYGRGGNLVVMVGLVSHPEQATYCPFDWGNNRTRQEAHKYIAAHWFDLPTGAVIDVECILGETATPKRSERDPEPDANIRDGDPAEYGDRG